MEAKPTKERTLSPFKFLDAYQEEDTDIFFGRETETEALYSALSGVKHLLVYGPSGAGKTSLIECGLRNQFSDADWFALTIRREQNILQSFYAQTNKLLGDKALELDPTTGLPTDPKQQFTEAVGRLFSEYYRPVYLLFDQFEELLILGSKEEKEAFFSQLNTLIHFRLPCRVLLIMREEFIGHLSEFEQLCPSIFQNRFRLEKMRKNNVKEVLLGILEAPFYADAFQVKEAEQLAQEILEHLPDKSMEIELTHVQVFLNELWERAIAKSPNSKPVLEESLIRQDDNLEKVLDQFLKKQLQQAETTFGKDIPLELLACMISSQKTKLLLSKNELAQNLKTNEVRLKAGQALQDLLDELEKCRIIRIKESSNDENRYEIAHDLLALLVGQNLPETIKLREKAAEIYKVYLEKQGLLTQNDLDYLRPYESYKAYPRALKTLIRSSESVLVAELNVKRRNLNLLFAFIVAVAITILILFFWALHQKGVAEEELAQNQRILNSMYFYEDEYALVMRQDSSGHFQYGYMNKEGYMRIPYEYTEASPFDEYGYARVKVYNKLYLIDTNNRRYPLAESVNTITDSTLAVSLREQWLDDVPEKITKNKQLEVLLLRGNQFSKLPDEMGDLKNLKTLDLGYNKLDDLPASLSDLKELEILDLQQNLLDTFALDLGTDGHIKTLNLSRNYLENFPDIRDFTSLENLDVSENQIKDFGDKLTDLDNLRYINVIGNEIKDIPERLKDRKELIIISKAIDMFNAGVGDSFPPADNTIEDELINNVEDILDPEHNLEDTTENDGINNDSIEDNNLSPDPIESDINNDENNNPDSDNLNETNSDNLSWKDYMKLDCSNAYSRKIGEKANLSLHSKKIIVYTKEHMNFNWQFLHNNRKTYMQLNNVAADHLIPKGEAKISFVSETGEDKFYFFIKIPDSKNNTLFINHIKLSKEDLRWICENKIVSFRIYDLEKIKMTPYRLSRYEDLKDAASCMLQGVLSSYEKVGIN